MTERASCYRRLFATFATEKKRTPLYEQLSVSGRKLSMKRRSTLKRAISRAATVLVVVIVVVIIAAGGLYGLTLSHTSANTSTSAINTTSTTGSASSTTSSPYSSSSSATSTSTGTNSTGSPFHNDLVIDDANWPADDLNQLYAVFLLPWPNWLEDTVYQPLIGVNQTAQYQDGVIQYIPALVENWTVSPDSTKYTFNLRPDVRFSNGDPFNAYQLWLQMYGFYYLTGNASAWLESYALFDMSNVTFGPATINLLNQSGLINPSQQALSMMKNSSWPIYATGPYTLVFQLKAPFAYFLGTLVAYEGLVFDTQWLLDHGGFGTPTQFNPYFNQHPIPGSGPYVVSSVSENSFVQFTQDQNYWGKNLTQQQIAQQPIFDPGHARNVIVNYKPDDLTRYTDLSSGASQVSMIETADWNLVTSNPNRFTYLTMPSWNGEVLAVSMNSAQYPTNITSVRQAIVHAINYTDVADKAFFGQLHPFVGPEYPAWSQYYNLGNYTPYQTNITLAQNYLTQANIKNFPVLNFTVISGCQFCMETAQIVQSNLAQIGITVNIVVQLTSDYYAPYVDYNSEFSNPSQIGSLSMLGAEEWGPSTLTPADYWLSFVSNYSLYGNWAVYSSPPVDACANAFTSSTNVSFIQSVCKPAQAQVYNDAPYAWLGVAGLWYAAGSLVWDKSVVSGFQVDPVWDGQNTIPIFNTLTFGS